MKDSFAGYEICHWQLFHYYYSTLNMSSYWLLAFILSDEESALVLLEAPCTWGTPIMTPTMSHYSPLFQYNILIYDFQHLYYDVSVRGSLCIYSIYSVLCFLDASKFSSDWENFQPLFLQVFFPTLFLLSYVYVGISHIWWSVHFSSLFAPLCSSDCIISNDLCSGSLIFSDVSSSLLLSPSVSFSF